VDCLTESTSKLESFDLIQIPDLQKYMHDNCSDLKLDWEEDEDIFLARCYYFARESEGLKDYQARSFSSELTLFYFNKIISTNVELVYREDLLDSYFKDLYQVLFFTNGTWDIFIEKMLEFYKSTKSWDFEKSNKNILVRLSQDEIDFLDGLGCRDFHQLTSHLLKSYDFDFEDSCIPSDRGAAVVSKGVFLTQSEYDCFMSIPLKSKTDKFLQLLYYFKEEKNG